METVHRYQPYGTAIELFTSRDPEILVSGPAGTGKSRACIEKIHLLAMLNPGARILMVRKTLASQPASTIKTYEQHVATEHLASGEVTWFGGSTREPASYRYKNGSVIVLGGMDKAMKVMSTEYDVIYVNESTELTENDWESLTTRLRNGKISFQQLIADCNPDKDTHWLKVRCDKGQTKMIYSDHKDNPVLYDPRTGSLTVKGAAYMQALDNLTGIRYLRLRKGIWAAAEGLVYDEYDPQVHLHPAIKEPPHSWERFLSIDFGYKNPFVCQWWAKDGDGRLYLYRELYMTQGLVEDHARTILKYLTTEAREPKPTKIITDHDAEGRATLEKYLGMPTTAAKKTVTEGIQAVSARFRVQPDGKPRIYICRDALIQVDQELADAKKPVNTEQEITGYIWADNKEEPVKSDDHGMDAMRYIVAFLDLQPKSRYRSFTL